MHTHALLQIQDANNTVDQNNVTERESRKAGYGSKLKTIDIESHQTHSLLQTEWHAEQGKELR